MKYLKPILQGLMLDLLSLLAPVIVPFALLFVTWDKEPSAGSYGLHPVIRGSLPSWLAWLETPDERLPGGLYEKEFMETYQKFGPYIASFIWLGIRNRMFGLAKLFSKPTTDYAPELEGYWQRGDIWKYVSRLGPIKFVMGYQVYRTLDRSFYAAPAFSIKWRPKG